MVSFDRAGPRRNVGATMAAFSLEKLLVLQERDRQRLALELQLKGVPREIAAVEAKISAEKTAIETAMLAVLTRRPSDEESQIFRRRLHGTTGNERTRRVGDLYWTLLNTTEFSWNH